MRGQAMSRQGRAGTKPAVYWGVAMLALVAWNGEAVGQTCQKLIPDSMLVTPGHLTMATSPTLPPMQYVDQAGQLKGMRVELGTEIAKRLCLQPDYIRVEYVTMIPGLRGGRWDMINAGLFVTPERLKILDMIPYENLAISISTAINGGPPIHSVDDLAGKAIGVDIGGYAEAKARDLDKEFKQRGLAEMTIHTFDGYAAVYQAVRAGQVAAGVSIDPVAKQYQERGEFTQSLKGLYATPGSLSFGNHAIAEAVSKILVGMKADGSFDKLLGAYGVEPTPGNFAVLGPNG
jgi:polar amino acid transport system substrate-binding protein